MSELKEQQSINNPFGAELIQAMLREKRSEKRWKNFRFFAWFSLILFFTWLALSSNYVSPPSLDSGYVSLIQLSGTIEPGSDFSAETIVPALKQALADERAKGLILTINSGGGTPVQASIIHDAILSLKKKYHKKVVVVGEDFLASGAYYVAVAADQIYVNPNTITGSVGVIMKGFGFTDLLNKLGIERRVYMSGIAKDRLDPFLPQNKDDVDKANQMLGEVQENFNQAVLEARRGRLHADPATLFNGDFWSGTTALKLGLVDGLGNLIDVMDREFKVAHYRNYTPSGSFFNKVAGSFGTSLASFIKTLA
ncbi:MAG TPA: S49 family peptidase [Gammaproteobacteria bacterium]|nr:S49 family peptidase [Gammaproteobacteria bacterium]